jgi:uncharacterized protein (UPF0332 family)
LLEKNKIGVETEEEILYIIFRPAKALVRHKNKRLDLHRGVIHLIGCRYIPAGIASVSFKVNSLQKKQRN